MEFSAEFITRFIERRDIRKFKKLLNKLKGKKMTIKIESLTPEQEAKLSEYAEYWKKIGLSTERADKPRAEAAIEWMYKDSGYEKPEIIWCQSPRDIFKTKKEMYPEEKNSLSDLIYGNQDAHWIGTFAYYREVLGLVEETKRLHGLYELAHSAHWALPYDKVIFISDRPSVIKQDKEYRLHCEDGPAISYTDGFSIYAIHGVRLPHFVIEAPEKITVDIIEKETNVEVKRIMIQRYKNGYADYIKDSNSELIDEQPDIHSGLPVKLWKKEREGDTPIVMVEMKNKTEEPDENGNMVHKSYYIRVKPDITDAIEAIAWHQNQTKEDYLKTQVGT